ncbi:hypothetical protein FSP39_002192 [Pinctada imbricata]|uniref:Apple domain-containing protein n=1 Tax=Pinctada imbricata TaxID=66713 RepID=A0AA88Y9Z9_PINIB|nr:hypothetical protein FSP39_002192 [Pinctada imbricata]
MIHISCYLVHSAQTVFSGKPEILISPGLVKREGLTLDTCAKACLQEKTIKCQFFKFINDTRTCFLSETDHPKIQKLIHQIKPHVKDVKMKGVQVNVKVPADLFDPEFRDTHRSHHKETSSGGSMVVDAAASRPQQSHHTSAKVKTDKDEIKGDTTTQKLREMMSRVHNLEKQLKKVKKLQVFVDRLRDKEDDQSIGLTDLIKIDKLEKRVLKKLNKKLTSLKYQSRDIDGDLKKLHKTQTTFNAHVKKLQDSNSQLGGRIGKLKVSTANLGNTVEQIKKSDKGMKARVKKIESLSAKIRAKLEEFTKSGLEVKTSEDKLGENHKKILQAVRNIAAKSKSLGTHLKNLSFKMTNVSKQLQHSKSARKGMKEDIARIMKNIKSLQTNVIKISDPKSPETRKWQLDIGKLKNLISSLSETDKNIKSDIKGNKNNMAKLMKELTKVQLSGQRMKSKLTGLKQTTEQIKTSLKAVQKEKALAPDSVTLAKIEGKLRRFVILIYTREKITRDKLSAFNRNLRKVEEQLNRFNRRKGGLSRIIWKRLREQSKDLQALQHKVTAESSTPFVGGQGRIFPILLKMGQNMYLFLPGKYWGCAGGENAPSAPLKSATVVQPKIKVKIEFQAFDACKD